MARSFPRLTAIVLAVVLLGGATDLFHARAWDVCDFPPATHDANAHAWTAAGDGPSAEGEHCYLCHWLRSLRSGPALTGRVVADGGASDRVRPAGVLPEGRQASSLLPARSPPL